MAGPWEAYQQQAKPAGGKPWEAYAQPAAEPEKPQPSVLGDVVKQGAAGLAEGVLDLPSRIYRDIMTVVTGQKQPEGGVSLAGPPQTKYGEYARSIGGAVGNPQSYVGGGAGGARLLAGGAAKVAEGLLPKALGALGAGAGSQAGGDVAGAPGAIVGGLLGGAAGGAVGARPKAPVSNVPTTAEIGGAASATYKSLADAKHPLDPMGANNFVAATVKKLDEADYFAAETPKTFKYLERLTDPNNPPTSSTVMSVRRQLGRVIRNAHNDADEAAAAAIARGELDQYFERNTTFGPQLKEANANYRAKKIAQATDTAKLKGQLNAASSGHGANEDNAMRESLKALLLNPKFSGSPRVKEEVEKAVRGGWTANTARWFGRFAPTHTIREVAKAVGGKATGSRVDMINEMIRLESPLAKQRGSTPTPGRVPPGVGIGAGATRGAKVGEDHKLFDQ